MNAAIATLAGNSAKLTIYNGTRPVTGGTATTALAQLTCNASGFGTSSGGVLTAAAISSATASATGTATWARLTSSGGTFVADFDVATSGADITINTASVVSGATVSCSAFTYTAGNA
jgi:hypothetical protein